MGDDPMVKKLHSYFAFGLGIRSELPLPELTADDGDAFDVDIRLGAVPDELSNPRFRDDILQAAGDDHLITIAGVARYRIHAGREVVIEPAPAVGEQQVRAYLLGSVLGALCHVRGLLPLHANAIEVAGRAIAFAGHSGAGKSTLATAFHEKGYKVLSDDICVLSFLRGQVPMAWPGIPHLRMWRDTADALGKQVDDLVPVPGGKFHLPLLDAEPRQGLPLAGIYVLSDPDVGGIVRLSGAAALEMLMMHTYRQHFLEVGGARGAQFTRNVQLLAHVPVFRLPWRKDFSLFAAETAKLEEHLLADLAADRKAV